jgi:hypothetical protein
MSNGRTYSSQSIILLIIMSNKVKYNIQIYIRVPINQKNQFRLVVFSQFPSL